MRTHHTRLPDFTAIVEPPRRSCGQWERSAFVPQPCFQLMVFIISYPRHAAHWTPWTFSLSFTNVAIWGIVSLVSDATNGISCRTFRRRFVVWNHNPRTVRVMETSVSLRFNTQVRRRVWTSSSGPPYSTLNLWWLQVTWQYRRFGPIHSFFFLSVYPVLRRRGWTSAGSN